MFELEFERGRIEELFVRVDGCFAGRVEEPRLVSTPVAFQPVLTVEHMGLMRRWILGLYKER